MLQQSIQLEKIIYKASVQLAEMRANNDPRADEKGEMLFDYLREIGVPANGIIMVFNDPAYASVLNMTRRSMIKCSACGDVATSMIRTQGGHLMFACAEHHAGLTQLGALGLLGFDLASDDDTLQQLRRELVLTAV